MKMNVGKIVERVVDNMTPGRYIPTNSIKSEDDCADLNHNSGDEGYIESGKN